MWRRTLARYGYYETDVQDARHAGPVVTSPAIAATPATTNKPSIVTTSQIDLSPAQPDAVRPWLHAVDALLDLETNDDHWRTQITKLAALSLRGEPKIWWESLLGREDRAALAGRDRRAPGPRRRPRVPRVSGQAGRALSSQRCEDVVAVDPSSRRTTGTPERLDIFQEQACKPLRLRPSATRVARPVAPTGDQ